MLTGWLMGVNYQEISNCYRPVLTYWPTDWRRQWLTDCWSCTAFCRDSFSLLWRLCTVGHAIFYIVFLTHGVDIMPVCGRQTQIQHYSTAHASLASRRWKLYIPLERITHLLGVNFFYLSGLYLIYLYIFAWMAGNKNDGRRVATFTCKERLSGTQYLTCHCCSL